MLSVSKTSFWKGGGQQHLETSKQLKSFRERKVFFCLTNIVLSPLKVAETLSGEETQLQRGVMCVAPAKCVNNTL